MGGLRDAHRTGKSAATGYSGYFQGGGFTPVRSGANPGDPDFSYAETPDSQAQFPAAAAEKRLFDNSRRAQNILNNAVAHGIDINSPEYAPVREAAERGLINENVPLGFRMLGWLDGPRQFINLALQDMAGGAEEGKRNPHVGDYLNALFGGVEQGEMFKQQTGLEPVSGSRTLELMGWDEEDDTGGRFGRGVADFALQAAIDPLTYVTFGLSALGKKVARAAANRFADDTVRVVTAAIANGTVDQLDHPYLRNLGRSMPDLRQDLANRMRTLPPDSQGQLRRYMKRNYDVEVETWDDVVGAASQHLDDLAIRNKVAGDVLQPALRRDWKTIQNAGVSDLLPAYMRGGMRISFPFAGVKGFETGLSVPGTVGLGRKIIGDPFRKIVDNFRTHNVPNKGLEWLGTIDDSLDVDKRMLKALGRGDIEYWQYHIAMNSIDALRNGAQKELKKAEINARATALFDRAKELGYEDQSQVLVHVLNRMEGVDIPDITAMDKIMTALRGGDKKTEQFTALAGLESELDEFASLLSETMGTYFKQLKDAMPRGAMGDIEHYVPHILNKEVQPFIMELARLGATNTRSEILSLQREGSLGGVLLSQLLNAVGKGGRIEQQVGASRYVNPRELGLATSAKVAMALTDDGPIMMPKATISRAVNPGGELLPGNVETSFMPVSELNVELANAIRKLAASGKYRFVLPKNWDGKVFSENPLEIISGYIDNMDETARLWQTMDSLKAAGLAFGHRVALDVPETAQAVMEHVYRNAEKVTREIYPPLLHGSRDEVDDLFTELGDEIAEVGEAGTKSQTASVMARSTIALIEDHIGRSPLTAKIEQAIELGQRDKALTLLSDLIAHTHKRPNADPNIMFHANWITSQEAGDMVASKGAVHFGTQASARQRASTIKKSWLTAKGKPPRKGRLRSARINPKKPYGSPTNPVPDSEQYSLLPAGEVAGTPEEALKVKQYFDDLRAEGYDAVYYRNEVEDMGSVSVAVLDPKIIEWGDEFKLRPTPKPKIKREGGAHSPAELKALRDWYPFDVPPTVVEEGKRVLPPIEEFAPRFEVTRATVNHMASLGMSASDIAGNKQLLGTLNGLPGQPGITVEQFLSLRLKPKKGHAPIKRVISELEESTGIKIPENITPVEGGVTQMRPLKDGWTAVLRYSPEGKLTVVGRFLKYQDGTLAAIDMGSRSRGAKALGDQIQIIDDVLRTEMKQKLSWANMEHLLNNAEISDQAGKALYNWAKLKMAALSDEALHLINNGEPQEFTRFKAHVEMMYEMLNDVLTGYGHFFDTGTGKLLPTSANPRFKLIADEEYENILDNAHALAEALDLPGLKDAFGQKTRKFTGLAEAPGFVNPNIFALGGPALSSLQVQKDIAMWLRQAVRNSATIYTPEGVAALKLSANEGLRWWKAMATIARPAFHIRNFVGGIWNGMIAGVGPTSYAWVGTHGITLKNALRSGKGFDEAVQLLPAADREVWEAAFNEGVLTSGFTTSDFRKLTAEQKAQRLSWVKVWDVDNFALTRGGALFMESIEDFMRMATFKTWYKKAGDAKVAAEMVDAVHFNYSKLTPFETSVKSIIPFFVWTRRNIPLQLSVMLENPRLIQRYRNMMQSMDDNFGPEQEEGLPSGDNFSAYAAGTRMMVNKDTPFWARVIIDPDLPIKDIAELQGLSPPDLVEFANGLLGPHVSTLVDMNREREFGDVNAPAPLNTVLKSLAMVGLFDNTLSGDVRIPYWMRTVFETSLPFSRETVEPLLGGPTDPRRQQQFGISEEDEGVESALKAVAFSLARGFGVKLSTPQDVRSSGARTQDELDTILSQLRFTGQAPAREG